MQLFYTEQFLYTGEQHVRGEVIVGVRTCLTQWPLQSHEMKLVTCAGELEKTPYLFCMFSIVPVSKYLGTRSSAGLGATSGQSLPRTCKFRSEIIDLLYCLLLFFFPF